MKSSISQSLSSAGKDNPCVQVESVSDVFMCLVSPVIRVYTRLGLNLRVYALYLPKNFI